MIRYLLRRFVNYVILTMIATVLAYAASSVFMNPAARFSNRNPPIAQSSIDSILDNMGVNPKVPVAVRTWNWFTNLLTAPWAHKLGMDMQGTEVVNAMSVKALVSLRLLIVGVTIGAILGVVLGVWGAVRQYKLSDQLVTYASYVLISTPTFVAGVILMIVATGFNGAVGRQVIRFTGEYTPNLDPAFWIQFSDRISHMILPTIALALFGAAGFSRYQRSTMLDVLGSDYIRTARAKGATRNHALVKHGVRVALIPMSTYFAYQFGGLLAGSTFLEIVFSWNGMGRYGIDAIQNSDINAVAGNTMYAAILVLFSSMLSEILYSALDPRVRN